MLWVSELAAKQKSKVQLDAEFSELYRTQFERQEDVVTYDDPLPA